MGEKGNMAEGALEDVGTRVTAVATSVSASAGDDPSLLQRASAVAAEAGSAVLEGARDAVVEHSAEVVHGRLEDRTPPEDEAEDPPREERPDPTT